MSTVKGRPPTDNPKNIQVKFRADQRTVDDINFCCAELNKTKSDVIRLGIEKVKSEIEKK